MSTVDVAVSAPDVSSAVRPSSSPTGRSGDVSTVHAAGLRWRVLAAGSGDPIVFIHGTGSSLESWRDVLPPLASKWQVIAMDLPGHGHTQSLPRGRVSLPAMADGVARCLETIGVIPHALVGHSAGAAIALKMAIDGHTRPGKIIGFNPALFPFGGRQNPLLAPFARLCATLPLLPGIITRRASDARAIERLISGTGSSLSREGIAIYQQLFTNERHVRATMAMMANWDLTGLVASIGTWAERSHFIVGERDAAVDPSEGIELQRRYPQLRVDHLAEAGHLAHEERPLESAAIIESILSGRSGS